MSECVLSVCMCCMCDVSAICTTFTIYTRKARARGRQSPHSHFQSEFSTKCDIVLFISIHCRHISLRSSSGCLRLNPHPPVPSIVLFIFNNVGQMAIRTQDGTYKKKEVKLAGFKNDNIKI